MSRRLDRPRDDQAGCAPEQRAERRRGRHVLQPMFEDDDQQGERRRPRATLSAAPTAPSMPSDDSGWSRPAVNAIAATNNVRASVNQVIRGAPRSRMNEAAEPVAGFGPGTGAGYAKSASSASPTTVTPTSSHDSLAGRSRGIDVAFRKDTAK
ncbi:MAG: hypothetical protein MZV63_56660 [Marinilabiliales bacterium]|nr:hypothetical protein [Marinilabiliales bacterium]